MTAKAPVAASTTDPSSFTSARTNAMAGFWSLTAALGAGCRDAARTVNWWSSKCRTMRRPRNPVAPKTTTVRVSVKAAQSRTMCAAVVRRPERRQQWRGRRLRALDLLLARRDESTAVTHWQFIAHRPFSGRRRDDAPAIASLTRRRVKGHRADVGRQPRRWRLPRQRVLVRLGSKLTLSQSDGPHTTPCRRTKACATSWQAGRGFRARSWQVGARATR